MVAVETPVLTRETAVVQKVRTEDKVVLKAKMEQ